MMINVIPKTNEIVQEYWNMEIANILPWEVLYISLKLGKLTAISISR